MDPQRADQDKELLLLMQQETQKEEIELGQQVGVDQVFYTHECKFI